MIPAGPERDKRIAELRGDEYVGEREFNNYLQRMITPPPMSPKYSTDISAAMELWGEIGMQGAISMARHGTLVGVTIIGTVHMHSGETEADAISGAWLKWREGK